MKQQIPIRRFEYFNADSATPDLHFRLMTVDIDFEKRTLSLEGVSGEFIKVFATICPGPGFRLSETGDDGLFLSLDGVLEDSKTVSSCNGLLMLHSRPEKQGWNGGEWCLVIYLCDDYNERREIRLNLPMWPVSENAVLN